MMLDPRDTDQILCYKFSNELAQAAKNTFSPSSIDQYAQVAEMLSSLGFPELLEKFKSVMFKVC